MNNQPNSSLPKASPPTGRRLTAAAAIVATTIRGLRGQSRRLATTAFAVMFGVAFTAGTLVLTDTLRMSFDSMHADSHAGVDLAVRRPASFGSGPDAVRDRVDADLASMIATIDGVDVAAGRTTGWAQLSGPDGLLLGDVASGVDPIGENWIDDPRLSLWHLVDGVEPSSSSEVVIDRSAARALDVAVGDRVDVLALGGLHEMTVSGIAGFGDGDERFGSVTVMFDDDTAQRLLGERGHHAVLVALDDEASGAATVEIHRLVGESYDVVTGEQLTDEARAVHMQDWGFFDTFMKGFALIALIVGGFIIFNTFSITVAQRTREFALLRAIGAGRGQVLGSVLTESLTIGGAASLVGLAGGVGVATGLRSMFGAFGLELPDDGAVVQQSSLVVAFAVGVIITAGSALIPALRAGKTPPIAAMRETAVETTTGSRTRVAIGASVVVAGGTAMGLGLGGTGDEPIVLVGLGGLTVFAGVAALGPVLARPFGHLVGRPIAAMRGVPGQLARDNATRNPKRTAATASALMIGVGLVGFITVLAASVKASIDEMVTAGVRADIVVDSGSFGIGGFDRSLVDELAELPEVAAVSGMTVTAADIDGTVVDVVGVNSAEFTRLIDVGDTDGSLAGPDGAGLGVDQLAVNADEAAQRGWTVGTSVDVTLADGVKRSLTVGAVVDDPYIGLPVIVDTALLTGSGQTAFDIQVYVETANGVDDDTALAAVAATAARFPNAEVLDRAAFARNQSGLVDPLLGVVYALLAFAVLIATLGIANTLALSIMERTRELGTLRAIGATRSQVRTAIRWESVIIAGFGTLLGLVVGSGFGWAVVRALETEGIRQLVIPVVPLTVIAALAATAGIAAAVLPARQAARLDVLRALQS